VAGSLTQSGCIPCRYRHCSVRNISPSLPFLLIPSPGPSPTSNKNLSPSPMPLYFRYLLHPLFYTPTPAILPLPHSRFIPRAMLHTMAQRSSGADSRARSHWRPYNPTLIVSTSRSPTPYLNTLISAISTSLPIQHTQISITCAPHPTSPSVNHTRPRTSSVSTHTCCLIFQF
jgi:hypothetical protein